MGGDRIGTDPAGYDRLHANYGRLHATIAASRELRAAGRAARARRVLRKVPIAGRPPGLGTMVDMADLIDPDAFEVPAFLVAACPRLDPGVTWTRPEGGGLDYELAMTEHAAGRLLHVEDVRGGVACITAASYDPAIYRPTIDQARWIAYLLRRWGR